MVVVLEEFQSYVSDFERVWGYFRGISDEEETYKELCKLRLYYDESMVDVLRSVGFLKLPDSVDLEPLKQLQSYNLLGLETKTGRCLLEGRFVFPVRDMLGNILALIGWYPDEKKYITTPSRYFHRASLYFGLEQLKSSDKQDIVFVCEGIFDSLSLRSLGYNAFALMGVELSSAKRMMYPLLGRKVVGVSDRDRVGNSVREYDRWGCWRYLTWVGEYDMSEIEEENLKIKDIDDLIKLYDPSTLRSVIDEELKSNQNKIIKLEL